jgi:glycosyltransferase involved in cell wall biosynthesis
MSETDSKTPVSIIIPVHNEAPNIGRVLDGLIDLLPDAEIIVIDDGSTDNTVNMLEQRSDIRVIQHPYNIGNGAAIKSGIRAAHGKVIVMMDGDGQHNPEDVPRLLSATRRYDMMVGARTGKSAAALHRALANRLYNTIASYLVGRRVPDLTSGFRAIHAHIAKRFVYLLPNGFSYPTTLTIAVFRSGHTVAYEPAGDTHYPEE